MSELGIGWVCTGNTKDSGVWRRFWSLIQYNQRGRRLWRRHHCAGTLKSLLRSLRTAIVLPLECYRYNSYVCSLVLFDHKALGHDGSWSCYTSGLFGASQQPLTQQSFQPGQQCYYAVFFLLNSLVGCWWSVQDFCRISCIMSWGGLNV